MIHVITDKNIPLIPMLLSEAAKVTRLEGNEITREHLKSTDALLVRTVTTVNKELLEGTPVKFVGSATAGEDHIDLDHLQAQGICFSNAKGCNAQAVTDYVTACLAALSQEKILKPQQTKVGIIGVGAVGRCVEKQLSRLGFDTLLNDPPRAEREQNFTSMPLAALSDCDIITVHTPLTRNGKHPTHHLLENDFLQSLKPGTLLINTARGEVIDTDALLNSKHLTLCCDVFESEPNVSEALVKQAVIATPHIAGYSLAAKQRASLLVTQAFSDFFNVTLSSAVELPETKKISRDNWVKQTLNIYNPLKDSEALKNTPLDFRELRNTYALRDELEIID